MGEKFEVCSASIVIVAGGVERSTWENERKDDKVKSRFDETNNETLDVTWR